MLELALPEVRSSARLWKRTYLPSALIMGLEDAPFPGLTLLVLTLTRTVVPACVSRTKTSSVLLVSPGTRSFALLVKATYRPFPLIAASKELPLPEAAPLLFALIRMFVPISMSRRKTSRNPFVSPTAGLSALLENARYRPLVLI